MQTDITNAVIPLWAALVAAGGVLTALGGIVVWTFSTFVTKEHHNDFKDQHIELKKQVDSQNEVLSGVARDVSYIRGRMESAQHGNDK